MTDYDVAVIGAGHNGLVAGAYLAKTGLAVAVFEAAETVGGGLHTEPFEADPRFRRNHHAINLGGLVHSPVRSDLRLERHGAVLIRPPVKMAQPFGDGRALVLYEDPVRTKRSIAAFSERDAETYEARHAEWTRMAHRYQRPEWYRPAESIDERRERYDADLGQAYLDLCERSPIDVITDEFEDERVRTMLAGVVKAAEETPFQTHAEGLLVRAFNRRHHLCVARGGSRTVADALRRCLEAAGGSVHLGRAVTSIAVESGRATGIELADGTAVSADVVASAVHYPQTYLDLVGRGHLPESFVDEVETYEVRDTNLFGVHLALDSPVRLAARATAPDLDGAARFVLGRESLAERQAFHDEVREGRLPEAPLLNAGSVTVVDPTQAPAGGHVAHVWAPAKWEPEDRPPEAWDDLADDYAERCLDQLERYAPGVRDAVRYRSTHTPLDMRRDAPNRLRGSSTGAAGSDKPGARGPIEGLYLAGAPAHPGGTVCGAPGYNCAGAVVEDLGIDRWWEPPAYGE